MRGREFMWGHQVREDKSSGSRERDKNREYLKRKFFNIVKCCTEVKEKRIFFKFVVCVKDIILFFKKKKIFHSN